MGKVLKKDVEIGDMIRQVRGEVQIGTSGLISVKEINQVSEMIKDETGFGLMLYYGGSSVGNKGQFNEPIYYK